MSKGKEFEELALSFYGCDGGNLRSKIWFCGLEWGGDLRWAEGKTGEKLETVEEDSGYGDQERRLRDFSQNISWEEGFIDAVTTGVNQKICWFINYYLGLDRSDSYQYADFVVENKICFNEPDGIGFKMNLFPLNSRKHDGSWDEKRAQYTGLATRWEYEAWCLKNRGAYFQKLIKEGAPEVIIGLGKSHMWKFFQFFGCNESAVKEANLINSVTIFYCTIPETETMLVISPFFGGPYGINSFKKMQNLTTLVHQVRGTESIDWG